MKNNGFAWGVMVLAALLFLCGAAGASNLTLEKTVVGNASVGSGEKITWLVTVSNLNKTTGIDVNVTEQVPLNCTVTDYVPKNGTMIGNVWNVTLPANSTDTLRVNMTCSQACGSRSVTNIVNITSPDPSVDNVTADNNASSNVAVTGPDCVSPLNIRVRPMTLNLKSKGVITVFFTVGGSINSVDQEDEDETEEVTAVKVNRTNSTLTCNGVNATKILFSMKDNGTVMGKFPRKELALEASNGSASLNCSGTVVLSDGRTISIQGKSEIKVIHADDDQKGSLFQKLLRFLGLIPAETDDGNVSETTTTPVIPEDVKNFGQLKKLMKTGDLVIDEGDDNITSQETQTSGKGKPDDRGNGNGKNKNPSDELKGKGQEKKNP